MPRNGRPGRDEAAGYATVDFRGAKRANATHLGSTGLESVGDREVSGKEGRMGLGGRVLIDNRHGLCAEFQIRDPMPKPAPMVVLQQGPVVEALESGERGQTVDADKAYHRRDFGIRRRQRGIAPQATGRDGVRVTGLDGRREGQAGLASQSEGPPACRTDPRVDPDGRGCRRSQYRGAGADAGLRFFVLAACRRPRMAHLTLAAGRSDACGELRQGSRGLRQVLAVGFRAPEPRANRSGFGSD